MWEFYVDVANQNKEKVTQVSIMEQLSKGINGLKVIVKDILKN